ncbi:MAG: hypothetical protein M3238_02450, partial [Actinomycetota bacterium]|nr:hypothetical protein [Actinomycetota bacterium]
MRIRRWSRSHLSWRDAVFTGCFAGTLSSIPSTVHALAIGGDAVEASVAAGSMLLPNETRRPVLIAAALPVHVILSIVWAVILARVLGARA